MRGRALQGDRARRVELVSGRLLSAAAITSLAVVIAGLFVSFMRSPHVLSSPDALVDVTHPGAVFPHTAGAILSGLAAGSGPAIVMAGLFLLIITPVLRVAALIVAFGVQRDRALATLSGVVLALLLLSFALGRSGG